MTTDRKRGQLYGPGFFLLLTGFLLSVFHSQAWAGELSGLHWLEPGQGLALELQVDPRPVYEVERLSGGKKLRLVLMDTTRAKGLRVPAGRDAVRSISLKSKRDGRTVLDFKLREAGRLEVAPSAAGYQVNIRTARQDAGAAAPVAIPSAPAVATAAATDGGSGALTAVSFSRISGNRVQFDLRMDGNPPEPVIFRTIDPPRIALDFFGMRNASGEQFLKVNTAQVDSVVAAGDEEKLRLVVNLLTPADYELTRLPTGYALTVGALESSGYEMTREVTRSLTAAQPAGMPAGYSIRNVDFRRTPAGAGRVIIELSDPELAADVRDEGMEIIVDFRDTGIPAELERRMDVLDFATPVNTVDAYGDGRNARIVITPSGRYTYSSIQTGVTLMVDIAPLTRAEEEAEKVDEFGYTGERLSLNFQKISVRAALQVIADFTGLNFVTSDAISGDLSLRLQDVPWDQALDVIMQTKGLAKRQKGNVIWVAPAEEIAAKEKQALEARQDVTELEPLVTELIPLSYAKAVEVSKMLKSIRTIESGLDRNYLGNVTFTEQKTEENTLLSERGSVTVDE
ncbi:MAG: AMIN domain-containing protein, partial [Pseudomonadota bacterium]|nr:AMIN domain-containing protein [Pseudomonadota bacterium]